MPRNASGFSPLSCGRRPEKAPGASDIAPSDPNTLHCNNLNDPPPHPPPHSCSPSAPAPPLCRSILTVPHPGLLPPQRRWLHTPFLRMAPTHTLGVKPIGSAREHESPPHLTVFLHPASRASTPLPSSSSPVHTALCVGHGGRGEQGWAGGRGQGKNEGQTRPLFVIISVDSSPGYRCDDEVLGQDIRSGGSRGGREVRGKLRSRRVIN